VKTFIGQNELLNQAKAGLCIVLHNHGIFN